MQFSIVFLIISFFLSIFFFIFFASVIQLFLFVRSYLFPSFFCPFVSPGLFFNSLMSSSHLLLDLPTNLLVLILLSRPGCQSKILLVHLSYGRNVFQSSKVFSFSSSVLQFLWYSFWCIQSSLLLQWWQFLRRCLLGNLHHCLGLCRSSGLSPLQFLRRSRTCFLLLRALRSLLPICPLLLSRPSTCIFFLVCTMRRIIFRCAVLIILSCFCDSVHVLLAYVNVGVLTMLNKRSLWHRRYALQLSSWMYLWNAAHAAFNLFLISSVSCSSNLIEFDFMSKILRTVSFDKTSPRFWCCRPWSLFFSSPFLGYWESLSYLGGFPDPQRLC